MQIITLCQYEGMSMCKADAWKEQEAGCTFAVKSGFRDDVGMYCKEFGVCDCPDAQKIAYENYNSK